MAGVVQGVGFRWYVMKRALAMGVRGWTRNLEDGSVEVVGLAEPGILADFEAKVRRGPPSAVVSSVATEDIPHEDVDSKSFTIKR